MLSQSRFQLSPAPHLGVRFVAFAQRDPLRWTWRPADPPDAADQMRHIHGRLCAPQVADLCHQVFGQQPPASKFWTHGCLGRHCLRYADKVMRVPVN